MCYINHLSRGKKKKVPDVWHLAFADFHGINIPTMVNVKIPTFKHLISKTPEYLTIGCQEPR